MCRGPFLESPETLRAIFEGHNCLCISRIMQFLTVERANKTEIDISTAREQKGLGTVGARHDGYQVIYLTIIP